MSFQFEWERLSDKEFVRTIIGKINEAIKSDKNADVVGKMHITELVFGHQAPEVEVVELNEVAKGKVKTSFNFIYEGDASVTFYTRVELNPFRSTRRSVSSRSYAHIGVLDSNQSLTAPIYITLSNFRLQGRVVLAYEKPYVIISLKNEALKSVKVNSSFDGCSASRSVANAVTKGLFETFQKLVDNPIRVRL